MDNFISLFVTLNPNVNEILTPTERASFIFYNKYYFYARRAPTVSSIMSGLETRSLGLNTLGITQSPASSQSVQVGRTSTASWV